MKPSESIQHPCDEQAQAHHPRFEEKVSNESNHAGAVLDVVHQLTVELSARFMKLSVDQIDTEIRLSIQKIVDILDLERGFLSQCSADGLRLVCTHFYEPSECKPENNSSEISLPPCIAQKILHSEYVTFPKVAALPEMAEKDWEHFRRIGTQSHLSLPLEMDGEVIGCMTLESSRSEFAWPVALIRIVKPLADVFAFSLERKRKKLELLERIRFENMLSDFSARFVRMDIDDVDREIEQALGMIGEFCRGDRCGILHACLDDKCAKVTHAWYASGIQQVSADDNLALHFPWTFEKLFVHGEVVKFSSLSELPPEADKDRETWLAMGVQSNLAIPLTFGTSTTHAITFNNMKTERSWPEEYIPRLRMICEVFINALMRKQTDKELRESYEEIRSLQDKLQMEAEFLRSEIRACMNREEIIGQSDALVKVLTKVEQVAPTDSSVLICGETGTGKELIAHAIHDLSFYRDKVMVKVNCASLPATLVESELFGREKGAYTGAMTQQIGRFELADGSTIFLDEIAELPLELQAKLLRVLQERTFERLGSPKTIKVQVRVIAATNRDILEEVNKGNFRKDLYYRLSVFPITVPPLRDRVEDIPMLVWAFVEEFCKKMGKQIHKITKQDMEELQQYAWPGNIRELRNIIEHAVIVSSGGTLRIKLPKQGITEICWAKTLEEVETEHIKEVLRRTGGRIKGDGGAANILGMIPSTLNSRMKKLGIR
jgi:formate hydrogenlyase transcriptional activator